MATLQGPVARPGRQIRKTPADASPLTDRPRQQGGSRVFPEDHRQHAHGESSVRHVQELIV